MNNVIVSLDRVSLSFEGQKRVLDQVDVTIKQGQHTLIKGASGSGKTSLLQIMAGLRNQFTGSAELLGHDLRGVSDAFLSTLRREKMGFVYQFHHLLPEFSVIENGMLPLLFNGQSRYAAQMQARPYYLILVYQKALPINMLNPYQVVSDNALLWHGQ